MSDPGDLEARPEPGEGRHRTDARRLPGRGILVVLTVAVVALAAGLLASDAGDRSSPPGTAAVTSADASSSPDVAASPPPPVGPGGPSGSAVPGPLAVPGPVATTARTDAPAPVSLSVPAIDVDLSSLDRLGVDDDGTIEVPQDPDDAGWLTASAPPGRTGPAVIAGHVDSRDGPAVFARLDELGPGDEVVVGLQDGSSVTYVVTGSETYPKAAFPTARVYGPAPAPVLRLITCGGDFDRSASSYEDNVVVYASLAA